MEIRYCIMCGTRVSTNRYKIPHNIAVVAVLCKKCEENSTPDQISEAWANSIRLISDKRTDLELN